VGLASSALISDVRAQAPSPLLSIDHTDRDLELEAQHASVRHMGPMAQDFWAAFGLWDNDKSITTVDADGVAPAAIQALHQLVQERDQRIAALERNRRRAQARLQRARHEGITKNECGCGIPAAAFAVGRTLK